MPSGWGNDDAYAGETSYPQGEADEEHSLLFEMEHRVPLDSLLKDHPIWQRHFGEYQCG